MSNDDGRRLAARLLILDHNRRTVEAEDSDEYAARITRILDGADLDALLRGVLDVLADADSSANVGRLIARGVMATYADGDALLDEVRRPGGDR